MNRLIDADWQDDPLPGEIWSYHHQPCQYFTRRALSRKDAQDTDATFSVTIQSSTVSIRRPYATDTMRLAAYLEIRSVKSASDSVTSTKQDRPSDVLLVVFRLVKKFMHHDFGLEGLYLSI